MRKPLLFIILGLIGVVSHAQTVLSEQHFSGSVNSLGWTVVDNNGTNGKWIKKTSPITLPNNVSYSFKSPTAANGYALMQSANNTLNVNSDLISPLINCSNDSFVAIEFQHWFTRTTNNSNVPDAIVYVSTDGVNWSQIYDAYNESFGGNAELVQLNISNKVGLSDSVYIKFHFQCTNNGWWAMDDIRVLGLSSNAAAFTSIDVTEYSGVSHAYLVQGTFQNRGNNPLTSATMHYSIDGGAEETETFSNFILQPFESQSYIFSHTADITTAGVHTITIYATDPNGQVVSKVDSFSRDVTFLTNVPVKNVLLEEFTTAPCGWCPGGATWIEKLMQTEGSYAIPVAHHAGFFTDAMTTQADEDLSAAFGGGAPQGSIDRVLFDGEGDINVGAYSLAYSDYSWSRAWENYVVKRHREIQPVKLNAINVYNDVTRELDVTIDATFYAALTGDFRFQCYIVEDSIAKVGSGYDQANYYYYDPSDPGVNPWLGQGTFSNGTPYIRGYVHNNVTRESLGGTWGTYGLVPNTTGINSTYSVSYRDTIPSTWRANHLRLVAFVHSYNSNSHSGKNEVLNVVQMPLNGSGTISAPPGIASAVEEIEPENLGDVSLYPNPANNYTYIRYNLASEAKVSFDIYNAMGQIVSAGNASVVPKGAATAYVNTQDMENGLYLAVMKSEGKMLRTIKFMVNK